jgi:hypothetical protein
MTNVQERAEYRSTSHSLLKDLDPAHTATWWRRKQLSSLLIILLTGNELKNGFCLFPSPLRAEPARRIRKEKGSDAASGRKEGGDDEGHSPRE